MNHVYFADSRNMSELGDASVHLMITSPPYWQLKDYGTEEQIGYHDTYEEYIADLNRVWSECERVLHPGCRMCINVGDQFARAAYYGRYKIIPIRTEIINHCESIGLDYMGAIIWQKLTTCNTTGGGSVMGSYPFPRNGAIMIDYEFVLVFKKLGKAPKISKETKENSRMTHEQWVQYFSGHWNVKGVRQDEHLAVFPDEIPRRLIRMYSFAGETVLDPFMGSGTTVKVAAEENRVGVGYEINQQFLPVIQSKLLCIDAEMHLRQDAVGRPDTPVGLDVDIPAGPPSRNAGHPAAIAAQDGPARAEVPGMPDMPVVSGETDRRISPHPDSRSRRERGGGEAEPGVPQQSSPVGRANSLRRIADPKAYDFGTRVDGRTRSGKLLVSLAEELSGRPDWANLTERERLSRIVDEVVSETGADRKLVRLGTRNALQKVNRFRELVRRDD